MPDLIAYGWSETFSRHFAPLDGLQPARVVSQHRTGYRIQTAQAECSARISGRLRHESVSPSDQPVVGDWVVVKSEESLEATIQQVLPRQSTFSRKVAGQLTEQQIVASNIDWVWIVCSLDQDFNLRRIERYLTLAWESGARPVIVLTKADLIAQTESIIDQLEPVAIGTPIHLTSCQRVEGLDSLNCYFGNHATVALLGSSGVGKSTLINALAGCPLQETGEVRSDGKGRHTTVSRQLLRLDRGGLIIDTPGMRELQLWEGRDGLTSTFGDLDQLASQCRFSDCQHAGEPGCAVRQAVEDGEMDHKRLLSYQKLQRELAHLERKQDVHAQRQEKQRIKGIMKSLRHHPKYKR